MKSIRWAGLVFTLLIVGVLGGLMAPSPSDAAPTLTVKIDGVQVAPVAANGTTPAVPSILITSNSTCTAAEGTGLGGLGYTACYAIRTSNTTTYKGTNGRLWKIQTVSGLTARLRIADQVGQDKFSLVGVRFVPVPWTTPPQTATPDQNTNEEHIIEVIMKNAFTSSVNVNNAASIATNGGYIWALRTGGEFSAGPTGSNCNLVQGDNLCDAIGDKVEFTGTGIFSGTARVNIVSPSGSAQNALPLSFTVAGPHADPILSFAGVTNADMAQVDPTYPRFDCVKAGAETTCQPDVTQTLKITLKGPDTFVLVGGGDGDASRCIITPAEQKTLDKNIKILTTIVNALTNWAASHPNHPPWLDAFIGRLQLILDAATQPPSDTDCPGATFVKIAQTIQQAADQVAFLQHGAVPAVGAPQNTGTIVIKKNVLEGDPSGVTFNFNAELLGVDPHFSIETDGDGKGSATFSSVPSGENIGGAIAETDFPAFWSLSFLSCESLLGGSSVNVESAQVTVVNLVAGDTLTCTFTNQYNPVE